MKTLITYYSRTNTTKIIAEELAKKLNADIEEIIDTKNRKGALGYISGGKDATLKKLTKIEKSQKNSADYDLVIIGTPIWSWNITPAIRTYITKQKGNLSSINNRERKVAFFCTQGGSGSSRAFKEMSEIIDIEPIATLVLLTKEVRVNKNYGEKIEEFIKKLK